MLETRYDGKKAAEPYDFALPALYLDKYWDSYAAFYLGLLLRDYDNVISLGEINKIYDYSEWVVIGPLVDKPTIQWVNQKIEGLGVAVADSAYRRSVGFGLRRVDMLVTDLDGLNPIHTTISSLSRLVGLVSVHLHGDNLRNAWQAIELFKHAGVKVLPTCQVGRGLRVQRVNGFTDGDRAVMLALLAGAKSILLVGMDFGGYPYPNSLEKMPDVRSYFKLRIAKHIIEELSRSSKIEVVPVIR